MKADGKVEDNYLLKGSLKKGILLFSIPLIITNLLQVLFNISDIAVIGHFSGSKALGSVGSCSTLIVLFTGFLIGLANGVNVVLAKYLGQKNENMAQKTIHNGLIISFVFGVLIFFVGLVFSNGLLKLLETKEDLIDGAKTYIRIYFIGMPGLAIYNFGNACYSAKGNTKKSLYILMISGILNVILNLLLVILFKLDLKGVAIASFVSQYLAALLILISFKKEKGIFKLEFSKLKLNKKISFEILSLGIPGGIQCAIFCIANLFIQRGVNSFSNTVVEGNSAALNADNLIYDIMSAFYIACASYMSQNYGAGNKKRVIQSYYISLIYSFLIGLGLGTLLFFFGKNFLHIFTNDKAVINEGYRRIKVMAFSYCISAFMDCTISASRGIGKSIIPTVIVIMGSCIFRIIWIYTIFEKFHTYEVLYLVYITSWIITAFFEILYFYFVLKKQLKQI